MNGIWPIDLVFRILSMIVSGILLSIVCVFGYEHRKKDTIFIFLVIALVLSVLVVLYHIVVYILICGFGCNGYFLQLQSLPISEWDEENRKEAPDPIVQSGEWSYYDEE